MRCDKSEIEVHNILVGNLRIHQYSRRFCIFSEIIRSTTQPGPNECFGISAAEAETAREIVAAWETARRNGDGLTVVRGQLIEQLHVDAAERVLAIYEATHT